MFRIACQSKATVHSFLRPIVATLVALGTGAVFAQGTYPERVVKVIVPYSAGGGADLLGRLISPKMSEVLGNQFVVDNRLGAGGIVGTDVVAKAPADGYTLLLTSTTHTMLSGLFKKLPFDPLKDFSAISLVGTTPLIIVVSPSLPIKNIAELVAYAKANPGKVNFASQGYGSSAHLAGELFKSVTGTNMTYISYKDSAQAFTDIASGRVQLMFPTATSILPQVKSGRLRGLAITGQRRSPLAPELMTVAESGLPGYDVLIWSGYLAPAGTPRPVIDRLHSTLVNLLQKPDTRASITGLGADPVTDTPAEFEAYLTTEINKWTKVIQEASIKLD